MVATVFAAAGLYFASAISFWVIRQSIATAGSVQRLARPRRDLRAEREELRAEGKAPRKIAIRPFHSRNSAADA